MSATRKTILIVEDEKAISGLLTQQLSDAGYNVILAEDGYEGVNLAQTKKPDLIILDVMMPKMDGFKVCRLIKFNEELKNIPIIMMTSLPEGENRATGEEVGADVYLPKPFKVDELFAKIRVLTGLNK